MIKDNKEKFEQKSSKTISSFMDSLKKIRTGRASSSILDNINVNYYGTDTPLNQVASITVPEARMIIVQPWDKSMLPAIEKEIKKSDLGLNPSNDGNIIRLIIPALTEETRKELVKEAKKIAELSRVGIRNLRREANELLKSALKDHKITEDEERSALDEIQKLTDKYIKDIDNILEKKEKEILEV
ncbi:MAG: ribosome recycling factor [Spirochaetes bacterium]|nr:ribosome recycling factor [Spirochaetota bacterium]